MVPVSWAFSASVTVAARRQRAPLPGTDRDSAVAVITSHGS